MNRNGFKGLLCGIVLACLCIGVVAFAANEKTPIGLVQCTQNGSIPYCKHKFANSALVDYPYAPGTHPNSGDRLVCLLTKHNNWYFTWDRRGHGWYNDKTYSFDSCQIGRQA